LRYYELVLVLSPVLSPDEATDVWEKVKGLISENSGNITKEDRWGMRRLAYPIKKGNQSFIEGNYILTRFSMDRAVPVELQTHMKLSTGIIRYLLVTSEPPSAAEVAAANVSSNGKPDEIGGGVVVDDIVAEASEVNPKDIPSSDISTDGTEQATEEPEQETIDKISGKTDDNIESVNQGDEQTTEDPPDVGPSLVDSSSASVTDDSGGVEDPVPLGESTGEEIVAEDTAPKAVVKKKRTRKPKEEKE